MNAPSQPRRRLRPQDAADYCGVSKALLSKLRWVGGGPVYSKLGGKVVVYDPADLDAWLDARKVANTSQPAGA